MLETILKSIEIQLMLIPIFFTLHELEEWNILKWYKKHYSHLPASTNRSIRIWILLISLVVAIITAAAILVIDNTLLFSLLFTILSLFLTINIGQHVIWTIQYRAYSVGLITALLLLFVLTLVHVSLVTQGSLNAWFYLLFLFVVYPLVQTIRSPHVMTREILGAHEIGIFLEKRLLSRPRQ